MVETRLLRGPNIYATWPCIKAVVDLGCLDQVSPGDLAELTRRLCVLLPSLRTNYRWPDGGADIAHIIEYVLLELQCIVGSPVDYGRAQRLDGAPRHCQIVCAYRIEVLIEPALEATLRLLDAVARKESPDLQALLDPLRQLARQDGVGRCAYSILSAARSRGIAVVRPTDDPNQFQLGQGARQRSIHEVDPDGSRQVAAGKEFVDALFPLSDDGRIPVIAVTGTNGKTTTALLIASAFRAAGKITGLATTQGVFIDGECIEEGDCAGYWSAQTVLASPKVEAAVLEVARGGILKRGLGVDLCDVAVVLNVTADHLGQDGVETVEELARVKGVVAQSARYAMVLNAEDKHCVAMTLQARPGVEVIYFSCDPDNAVLGAHLKQGGRAVYMVDGNVTLAQPGGLHTFFRADSLAVTLYGRARHNVANTLAAIAALVAQGTCAYKDIVTGIERFRCSTASNPLRLNFFKVGDVTVLLDYAHNPAAYKAILDTACAMGFHRIVGVITAPDDRRDADLQQIARICAAKLDEMVVYEIDELRDRAIGETAQLLFESGLAAAAGRIPVHKEIGARQAIWKGFQRCADGDLLLVGGATQVLDLERSLEQAPPTVSRLLQELNIGPGMAFAAPSWSRV